MILLPMNHLCQLARRLQPTQASRMFIMQMLHNHKSGHPGATSLKSANTRLNKILLEARANESDAQKKKLFFCDTTFKKEASEQAIKVMCLAVDKAYDKFVHKYESHYQFNTNDWRFSFTLHAPRAVPPQPPAITVPSNAPVDPNSSSPPVAQESSLAVPPAGAEVADTPRKRKIELIEESSSPRNRKSKALKKYTPASAMLKFKDKTGNVVGRAFASTKEDQKVVVIEKDGAMLKLTPNEYRLIRSADTQFQLFFDLTLTETMEPGTAPIQNGGANVVSDNTNNQILPPAPEST